MRLPSRSALYAASVVTVIVAVVAGLWVLGSPLDERARQLDVRRVADLHGIAAATDLYWTRHSALPVSLADLTAEPGVRITMTDPGTGEIYGYQPLDTSRYEVCASFERASAETSVDPVRLRPVVRASCRMCHSSDPVAPSRAADPGAGHAYLRTLWAHGSGRQCFPMEAERIGRDEG